MARTKLSTKRKMSEAKKVKTDSNGWIARPLKQQTTHICTELIESFIRKENDALVETVVSLKDRLARKKQSVEVRNLTIRALNSRVAQLEGRNQELRTSEAISSRSLTAAHEILHEIFEADPVLRNRYRWRLRFVDMEYDEDAFQFLGEDTEQSDSEEDLTEQEDLSSQA